MAAARPWLSTKRKIEYVSSDEENVDDPDPVEADEEDDVIAMYKPKKSKLDESVQKNFKTVMMDVSKPTPKPNIVYVSKYFLAKTENLVSKKVEEIGSDNDEKARAKEKDSKRQSKNFFIQIFDRLSCLILGSQGTYERREPTIKSTFHLDLYAYTLGFRYRARLAQ
jgi:hypothetical protein